MRMLAIAALVLLAAVASATTIVVPDDTPDIQSAVGAASSGDTVLLRPGTYDGPANTSVDFGGVNLVLEGEGGASLVTIDCAGVSRAFYFHSGEDTTSVVRGISVINGSSDMGAAVYCVGSSPSFVSCEFSGNTAQLLGGALALEASSARVSSCEFVGNSVLTNGYGQGGGGVHCVASSPLIVKCDFIDGYASSGSGVYCIDLSHPTIARCRFESNTAWYNGGGGVFCCGGSSPNISQCEFISNTAERCGGGVYSENSSPELSECSFVGNSALGADIRWGGGGAYLRGDSPSISSCSFQLNAADRGGAICCREAVVSITGSQFSSCNAPAGAAIYAKENSTVYVADCEFTECTSLSGPGIYTDNAETVAERLIFWQNESTGTNPEHGGGAIHIFKGSAQYSECTLAGNTAVQGGAVYLRDGASLSLSACTVSECVASEGGAFYLVDSHVSLLNDIVAECIGASGVFTGTSSADAECSDIWGNSGGDWVGPLSGLLGVSGNIGLDPLFCGGADVHQAYQLQSESPCTETASTCGRMGAWVIGCSGTPVEPTSWGRLKAMYR